MHGPLNVKLLFFCSRWNGLCHCNDIQACIKHCCPCLV